MKNRKSLLILALVASTLFANAQLSITSSLDSIAARMNSQQLAFPQEKLHIHNDKSYYIAGENIWFRAHLVDALTHQHDSTSTYVYGELIAPSDSLVSRVKIISNNGAYSGRFILKEELPEGTYTLRFYTQYMRNMGDDYFYKKAIQIGTPFSARYHTESSFTYSPEKDRIEGELAFYLANNNTSFTPESLYIEDELGRMKKLKIGENNKANFSFKIRDKDPLRNIYIEYEYKGNTQMQYIPIHAQNDDFDVSFHPEGGNLLVNAEGHVAFKALKWNGMSEEISGVLYKGDGDSITSFRSVHGGMGSLFFIPLQGESYYTICSNDRGISKRFELPKAANKGLALAVKQMKDMFNVSLTSAHNKATSDSLMLMAQTRGQIIYLDNWEDTSKPIVFKKDGFPAGVLHFLLVDKDMNTISERLVFNMHDKYLPQLRYNTQYKTYKKRQWIQSILQVKDAQGNPLKGNFSVSVTDDKDIEVDTRQNILTTLLLQSELKGFIESPSFYFQPNNKLAFYALDKLMMTQGWRRYNIPKVIKGEVVKPEGKIELSAVISGTVKTGVFLNNLAKDININVLSKKPHWIASTTSDNKGRFEIKGYDLVDSLQLLVSATTKKRGTRVALEVDRETYPSLTKSIMRPKVDRALFDNYLLKADQKYLLDNGIRLINLKEVEVRGSRKEREFKDAREELSAPFLKGYRSADIEKMGVKDVTSLLQRLPGVRVVEDVLYIRNAQASMVIDGVQYMAEDMGFSSFASMVNINDIDEINTASGSDASLWGVDALIMIRTKSGVSNLSAIQSINMATVRPFGFQSPVEFYSPNYSIKRNLDDPTPDLRTTIYWNPNVNVVDGKAKVNFYAADAETSYSVLIEGLTEDGKPIHTIQKIERKD